MNKHLSKYLFYYPTVSLKGERVFHYLDQYRQFQRNSTAEIEAYQLQHIQRIVKYALRHSDFYRRIYNAAGVSDASDLRSILDFNKLPTVSKQDLINSHEEMCAYPSRWSSTKTTGGSTGQPVRIKKNPDALARERAATWRAYEWAGIGPGDPQGRFWGVPHSQSNRSKAKIIDLIANRKRISAFNLTTESLFAYYQTLIKFRPKYLYGYVSAINALALHMQKHELPPIPGLISVITTSEILTPAIRSTIQNAMGVNVYNEYGCGEVGSIAHECEKGGMHIMSDNLYVQVDAPAETAGEIIVTDFFNTAMPLIRYRLGDFATLDTASCDCGRTLPQLKGIHGRAYDLIKTASGKQIHPEAVIYIFEDIQKASKAFMQFQAIQTAIDNVRVKIVPSPAWSKEIENQLIALLQKNIDQNMTFSVELCEQIDREPSGKMRVVKSLL
jgi:phenylacetate-coenzyme A ligase PaaK-like adenylate-forming protein